MKNKAHEAALREKVLTNNDVWKLFVRNWMFTDEEFEGTLSAIERESGMARFREKIKKIKEKEKREDIVKMEVEHYENFNHKEWTFSPKFMLDTGLAKESLIWANFKKDCKGLPESLFEEYFVKEIIKFKLLREEMQDKYVSDAIKLEKSQF